MPKMKESPNLAPTKGKASAGLGKSVVQIVDDDPAIVRLVRRYLELEGFQVIVAWDGKAALEQFDREAPNLVLLDIGLPEVDGWEVCRRMRSNSDVPVIMLTAKGREEEVIEGFDAGADDYLSKPFSRLLINGSPADRSGNSLKIPTISEVVESSLHVNVHSCYADAPFR